MKITKKQLRRIIREAVEADYPNAGNVPDQEFIEALLRTWERVRADVDIANPTWEDKVDEVTAVFGAYEPALAKKLDSMPFKDQDMMFRLAFDPEYQ